MIGCGLCPQGRQDSSEMRRSGLAIDKSARRTLIRSDIFPVSPLFSSARLERDCVDEAADPVRDGAWSESCPPSPYLDWAYIRRRGGPFANMDVWRSAFIWSLGRQFILFYFSCHN